MFVTYNLYPVTPTLSVDADQEKLKKPGPCATMEKLGGIEGGEVSDVAEVALVPPTVTDIGADQPELLALNWS